MQSPRPEIQEPRCRARITTQPVAKAPEKSLTPKPTANEKRLLRDAQEKTGENGLCISARLYLGTAGRDGDVDIAVLGDSLAMIYHGHRSTVPATMDMMVMHGQAVRRGAPNTFMLGCMPYQSYHTVDRALANASRFMQETLCDAVKPQGGKSHIFLKRWSMPAFRPLRTLV
jgi:3-methyl-2-oxobutanoate hydroxymethyltransferase